MGFSLSHGKEMDVGHFGLSQEDLPHNADGGPAGPVDLRAWFGPDPAALARPLELEIGSGKGTFLVRQAALLPGVNFIGVEWAMQFWKFAADRCRRHALENVRLVRAEAGLFVRCYVPDKCLRQIHIYFPDPWPKKRHHKRRLIQEPFLRQLWRILEGPTGGGGGLARIATDHSDYYQWMLDETATVADLFERLPFASPESAAEGELVGTNFERKYRCEGRPFHGMILRKR